MCEPKWEKLQRQADLKAALDKQVAAKQARKVAVKEKARDFFSAQQEMWAAGEARDEEKKREQEAVKHWYRAELEHQSMLKDREASRRKTMDEAAIKKWLQAQALSATTGRGTLKARTLHSTLRMDTEVQTLCSPITAVVRTMDAGTLIQSRLDPHIVYTQSLSRGQLR